jgi:hypothetical protein
MAQRLVGEGTKGYLCRKELLLGLSGKNSKIGAVDKDSESMLRLKNKTPPAASPQND